MSKNPRISIIVPIYDVEKFLPKCLESINNQSFTDFEVLLINDGSKDSSGKIANEFSKNRNNFHVFHNENNGLSNTRNFGIEKSRGEYISFIDSDDYVHFDFLKILFNLIKRHDSDISCCNYYLFFPKSKLKIPYPLRSVRYVYDSEKALKKLIQANTIHSFAWNKLYKKSLFTSNKIKFENLYFEDIATIPKLFFYSKKVSITNKPLYYYTQRKGSILKTMNANKVDDFVRSFGYIRDFLQQQKKYEIYKKSLSSYTKKVRVMKNIYIFNLHLKALNFRGIRKNLKNSSKSIKFFLEENYEPTSGILNIPFPTNNPKKRGFKK